MTARIACAHCKSQRICLNGVSCAICAGSGSKWRDNTKSPKGLVCSVCSGAGSVEPFSLKLQNRFLPYFAMAFVFVLLAVVAGVLFWKRENVEKVIGFAGTLIGSVDRSTKGPLRNIVRIAFFSDAHSFNRPATDAQGASRPDLQPPAVTKKELQRGSHHFFMHCMAGGRGPNGSESTKD